MAHLYFLLKQPEQPDRVLVWDTRTLSIGRSAENDLQLEDDEVSRKHAMLSHEDGSFEIGDYRTGNGTFVNGERVSQSRPLRPGDVISIGKLQMEFRQDEEHPARLGMKCDFASHLKTVGMMPQGADANATMLGLGDTAPPEEEFVVEPERGSGEVAFVAGERGVQDFQMRELDDSLNEIEFGGDDGALDLLDPVDPPPASVPGMDEPGPRAPATPSPAAAAPSPASSAAAASASPAPPASETAGDPTERLRKLKTLLDEGLITDEEFQAKRAEILRSM